jgi:hypothetical protein
MAKTAHLLFCLDYREIAEIRFRPFPVSRSSPALKMIGGF